MLLWLMEEEDFKEAKTYLDRLKKRVKEN